MKELEPTEAGPQKYSLPGHWALLVSVFLLLGFLFSIVQPLGRTPDETAHVQYAAFLANEQRLPVFETKGGGEAGYEAQHPPLYYAAAAVVYSLTSPLTENWRWYILRWATLLGVGLPLLFIARRYFLDLWPDHPIRVLAATTAVMLMPLTLLYVAYVNPDGMVLLWSALVLLEANRAARAPASAGLNFRLGLWCGLALLTKLSGLPVLFVALAAHLLAGKERLAKRLSITLGTAAILALPWYGRNIVIYGTPFLHTEGQYGTGLDNALREGFHVFGWLTWRETFLSTWIQRGWLPDGPVSWLCYGFIIGSVTLAAVGLWKRRSKRSLSKPLLLAATAIVLTFLGQQWAFWTQDVEFNAGGRYLLATMPGIILLIFSGIYAWPRLQRAWTIAFIALLLIMNAASLWNIDTNLNPRYAPDWKMWQFVPGEEPNF